MPVEILKLDHPQAVSRSVDILLAGGVVAFPTDTVYGIASLVDRPQGINRLYQIKSRQAQKAIPALIGDYGQLQLLSNQVPSVAVQLANAFWPGPLTLIIPRDPRLPTELSPYPTIGVRLPAHAFVQEVARLAGPLAATSANRSGENNPLSVEDVIMGVGSAVDLVIDGGNTPGDIPSTVVDCTASPPEILREGLIPPEEIFNVLSPRGPNE
jgi:L-threonylcarbamoyladenylate synthase